MQSASPYSAASPDRGFDVYVYYIEGIRQFMRTRGSVHDARVPLAYIYIDLGNPFRKDEYLEECEQEYPQKDLPSRIPRGIPLM